MSEPRERQPGSRWRLAAAGLWALLVLVWLLDVTVLELAGTGLALVRLLALVTLGATSAAVVGVVRGLLAPAARRRGVWLLGLVTAALLVGFTGLEHEVGKGYYADEGHYLQHARRVDSGRLFARSLVYPHLLYYVDGFALWLSELFPGATAWASRALYGVDSAAAVPWLVLRWVAALFGALTAVPVFLLAERLAGLLAATLAGGLVVFSALYHQGFHVNTCDVPSAFFAAVAFYWVGRLLERESTRAYLLAGAAAGLAAAAKYPAGLVAVAIVAAYLVHRVRERDLRWGLLGSGLVALAVFLALNLSILVYPEAALFGPRSLFFGARLYGEGGWIGVSPPSNVAYYLRQLAYGFHLPIAALALVGVFGLAGRTRRRLLELLPFPALYLALIGSMQIVVARNLYPVIPALAVLLGVAAAGVPGLLPAGRRRWAAALVALLALVPPAARTLTLAAAESRPSTREAMAEWIHARVPRGAGILRESYTPAFPPPWYQTHEQRFAFRFPEEAWRNPRFDFALLASHAYRRFLRPENRAVDRAAWYRRFFDSHRLAYRVEPGRLRLGPELRLYLLEPAAPARPRPLAFTPRDAYASDRAMLAPDGVRYAAAGQQAVFRGVLAAGRYRLEARGELAPGEGRVRLLGALGEPWAEARFAAEAAGAAGTVGLGTVGLGTVELELATAGAVFVHLELAPGSRLAALELVPVVGSAGDRPAAPAREEESNEEPSE